MNPIYIVDDESSICSTIADILKDEGYQTAVFTDAESWQGHQYGASLSRRIRAPQDLGPYRRPLSPRLAHQRAHHRQHDLTWIQSGPGGTLVSCFAAQHQKQADRVEPDKTRSLGFDHCYSFLYTCTQHSSFAIPVNFVPNCAKSSRTEHTASPD